MSEPTQSKFNEEVEVKDQNCRPQTVRLNKSREENTCESKDESDKKSDKSIGEAFFPSSSNNTAKKESPEQNNGDANKTAPLTPDKQNGGLKGEPAIMSENVAESASRQLRPKTVTTKSSDERKQQLVNVGAVSCKNPVVIASDVTQETQTKRSLSPKPKSSKCYVCGKEFLISSVKIHEKQCAKKFQRENEKQNIKDTQSGRTTPYSKKNESRLNHARNSPTSVNSPLVSKILRKLELEACYLCGREFFAHSLGVHETQCIKNWKASKTPEAKLTAEAKPGDVVEQATTDRCVHCEGGIPPGMEVFHKQQKCVTEKGEPERKGSNEAKGSIKCEKKMGTETTGVFRPKGLKTTPCYMCGVQFLPHSLKVHVKKCQSRRNQSEGDGVREESKSSTEAAIVKHLLSNDIVTPPIPTSEHSAQHTYKNQEGLESQNECLSVNTKVTDAPSQCSPQHRTPKKPRTVVCYICGLEFLKSSYAVHEKQCASKNKLLEQGETKAVSPKKSQTIPGTRKKPETSGDVGTPAPRKPKTQKCFVCGKEMLLSSLRIHEQQCQKKAEILKNINQQQQQGSPNSRSRQGGGKPKTQACYVCGEAFLTSSIRVHEAQCEKRWNANNKT